MSPRRNWDSPTPSLASECLPGTKGGWGGVTLACEGLGESQFRRLEKSLALCLLCDPFPCHIDSKKLDLILKNQDQN
jgi:hypothetical protein